MGRRKHNKPEQLLIHKIGLRVNAYTFQWMSEMVEKSDCQSVAELARRIIEKKKVIIFYKDKSLDDHWPDILKLTDELNAIGVNINQVTHQFHLSQDGGQRVFHALKIAERYEAVTAHVRALISLITQLEREWLQGSGAVKA